MQQSESAPVGASRLDRIRNYQSHEFWTILAMRPLAIALLLLVADVRAVTPNRLTLASFVCFVLSAALIAFGGSTAFVAAAILINVANFFDKMCDAVGWIVVGTAVGWAAWRTTADPIYLLLGPSSASFLIARGYSKWVEHAQNVARAPARQEPDAVPAAPPRRSGAEWLRLLGEAFSHVYWFDEVDLSFWIALFLILDRPAALAWVLAVSQAVGMVIAMGRRAWRMHKL